MQNPEFQSRQNSFAAENCSVEAPQLLRLGLIGMLTAGTLAIAAARVQAAALANWRYDPTARQLEVTVKEGVTPRYFLMAQPARIVLDLPNTEVGEVSVKETYSGAIRQVRVSQFQPGLTRIVMELSADAVFAPGQVKLEKTNSSTWVLHPLIANAPPVAAAKTSPSQTSSRATLPRDVAKAPEPVSALPPPPSPEIDLPSSFPPVQSKPSTAVVTVPPTATSVQVDAVQPAIAQPAVPPEGSDISPMTNNLMEGDVSLPPVARSSQSSQSSNSGLASLPTQAIPVGSPAESFANVSRIAQVSPTEQTTPLPPSTSQSAADLLVDLTQAVKLDVPPPVSLPAAAAVGMPASGYEVNRNLPVPIQPPLQIPAIAPVPASAAVEASKLGAIEIPSTLRISGNRPVEVTVPAITAPTPTELAAVPAIAVSAPPQTAMPPLSVPLLSAPIVVPKQPPSSAMQPPTTTVQPQLPTLQPSPLPILQPSASARQSSAPIQLQSPQLQSPQLQSPVRVMQPPISSVMQSGPPMVTLPSAVSQPPISSVMQPSVMQPSVMQPVMQPSVSPMSSAPAIASSPTQPPSLPQPSVSEEIGQSATVSVPPLQTTAAAAQAPVVSVPPLQPMSLPPATVTPAPMAPTPMAPTVTSEGAPTAPSTIEFGKSLPIAGATALNTSPATLPNYSAPMAPSVTSPLATSTMYQSSVPGLILPAGTMVILSYPGTVNLSLTAGTPRQEVLILQTEVRDGLGNIVFPRGSYVTGQFDTNRQGSRFIAMAISQRDRAIPFAAESDPINGNREISGSSLAVYSGAGALAGGLVSKFSGLGVLLGGAAGAATNLFTSPKPATIQPGQIIQVRMIREVR